MRTVHGSLFSTFQDVCDQLGLLDDDNKTDAIMQEASMIRLCSQFRDVFTTILMFHRPANPLAFWEKWKIELSHDFMNQDKLTVPTAFIINQVLFKL